MFDTITYNAVLVAALCMSFLAFVGSLLVFQWTKALPPDVVHRLYTRRFRLLFSAVWGPLIALVVAVGLILFWLMEGLAFSLPDVVTKGLLFAALCCVGAYMGSTAAGWVWSRWHS